MRGGGLRAGFEDLVALILPARCLICDTSAGHLRQLLCEACWSGMPRLAEPLCRVCGVPRPGLGAVCAACRAHSRAFRCARAVAPYEAGAQTLIQRLKYQSLPSAASPLTRLLVERDPFAGRRYDWVVAVPLSVARLRARGFNQAALLARRYAGERGLRYLSRALERAGSTVSQAASGRGERVRNVRGVFRVLHPRLVDGRRVLLVDDVVTTASTADAGARALRDAGAVSVDVLAVARTGQGEYPG